MVYESSNMAVRKAPRMRETKSRHAVKRDG
jgi:hypothetical protein